MPRNLGAAAVHLEKNRDNYLIYDGNWRKKWYDTKRHHAVQNAEDDLKRELNRYHYGCHQPYENLRSLRKLLEIIPHILPHWKELQIPGWSIHLCIGSDTEPNVLSWSREIILYTTGV